MAFSSPVAFTPAAPKAPRASRAARGSPRERSRSASRQSKAGASPQRRRASRILRAYRPTPLPATSRSRSRFRTEYHRETSRPAERASPSRALRESLSSPERKAASASLSLRANAETLDGMRPQEPRAAEIAIAAATAAARDPTSVLPAAGLARLPDGVEDAVDEFVGFGRTVLLGYLDRFVDAHGRRYFRLLDDRVGAEPEYGEVDL